MNQPSILCSTIRQIAAVSVATLLLVGCGGNKTASTLPGEETDECIYKDEVCADAFEFQDEYARMGEEEQDQMGVVLNSYIEHCENAREMCEDSVD